MESDLSFVTAIQTWIEVFMRRSMHDFILFAKERELSMSQVGAMFNLYHRGGCGVSDLGESLGVTSAAASQLIDRLVQQDLIQRTESPHDRRFKQIVLTEKGYQLLQEGIQARQTWLEELSKELTPQEQNQVMAAFNLLNEKARLLDIDEAPGHQLKFVP